MISQQEEFVILSPPPPKKNLSFFVFKTGPAENTAFIGYAMLIIIYVGTADGHDVHMRTNVSRGIKI